MSLILSSNTTDFTIKIDDPITLLNNKNYEAALTMLTTYNSYPNVMSENNTLKYSSDKGLTWKTISVPTGAYELLEINNEIQRQMIENNDYNEESHTFYINININKPTSKSILEINNKDYIIDFTMENSIASTLGFDNTKYSYGIYESPNVTDIEKVNAILVHCDLVTGSTINGKNSQVLYSFSPTVNPGYKIIEIPKPQLYYHPVVKQPKIDKVRIWLTDQNNKLIDLRGEKVTVCIMIKEVDNAAKDIKDMFENYIKNFKN